MLVSNSSHRHQGADPRQNWPRMLVALVLFFGAAVPASAQSIGSADSPAALALHDWAVTVAPAALRFQPDDNALTFATLRPSSPLQILGQDANWTYVYNPRTRGTAYVHSDLLVPSDKPSSYVDLDPPPVEQQIDRTAHLRIDSPLWLYPTGNRAAAYTHLDAGTSIDITGTVKGDDDQQWFRTVDGDYLPAGALNFSTTPPSVPAMNIAAGPELGYFAFQAYHWIDVDLNLPATMVAYAGDTPVHWMMPIIGRGPLATPAGNFSIIRRVYNETMDSSTIGIPRNGPGGYYLTGVLFTQYFTSYGASLHYNYWSSNWGYPGSHGCLGLPYDDAAYMWEFADYGTPISIHY
jgi:hypothetical protein